MNERKIDVIVYVTDEQAAARLIDSLKQTVIPGGYSAEIKITRRRGGR